jgi:hypothetical protein
MLFGAACVILWFMRMLQKPETAERIDAFFAPQTQQPVKTLSAAMAEIASDAEAMVIAPTKATVADRMTDQKINEANGSPFDLSAIKDNTFFRAEENPAWFEILDSLKTAQANDLSQRSVGEISYAQFIDQPEIYRGQVVTVRGTVMREELVDAPANDASIEQYHRLVLRPAGGGVWPIIAYSLELPDKFPRGDDIRADVSVAGIFFKNWSYSWQDGLGLAPVILAKNVDWQPELKIRPAQEAVALPNIVGVVAAAGLLAALVGWLAWRQSRRPSTRANQREIVISLPTEMNEVER